MLGRNILDIFGILMDAIALAQNGNNQELKRKLYDVQSELIRGNRLTFESKSPDLRRNIRRNEKGARLL
jgi:hypothetical protein